MKKPAFAGSEVAAKMYQDRIAEFGELSRGVGQISRGQMEPDVLDPSVRHRTGQPKDLREARPTSAGLGRAAMLRRCKLRVVMDKV
jgi:hypothetical protein